ncbi:MAG: hypothetical protein ABEJ76_07405 [Halanaeroarchaeum sp.]
MEVRALYLATSIIGGLGLFVVWLIIRQVRPWKFPVRRRSFEFVSRTQEAMEELAERGPSGRVEGEPAERPESEAAPAEGEGEEAETEAEGEEAETEATEATVEEAPGEPEPARPESLWDWMKLYLYTYQKRPR